MAYIEPAVLNDLNAVSANPKIMAGAGGVGIGFKARNALRQAQQILAPGENNIEEYKPTLLTGTLVPEAKILATR